MRRLAVGLVVVIVFVVGVIITFPTDRLLMALFTRLPPDIVRSVERVGSSRLGLRGLALEDVRLRPWADAPPLEIRSLSLRPSLLGLLQGRRGRPWHVETRACAGTASARLDRTDQETVELTFSDLDLVACLAPFALRDRVAGRASGNATVVVAPDARTWAGVLTLTDALWQSRNVPSHMALRADQATIRWRFDDVLHVDDFALANKELTAAGSGTVRFPPPPQTPELDLRVRVEPSAGMPQAHRDLLARVPGSPPERTGARTYRLIGPVDAPRLVVP